MSGPGGRGAKHQIKQASAPQAIVLWLVALATSIIFWLVGDGLGGLLWPGQDLAVSAFSMVFTVTAGTLVMLLVRVKALSGGGYRKGAWGLRRR